MKSNNIFVVRKNKIKTNKQGICSVSKNIRILLTTVSNAPRSNFFANSMQLGNSSPTPLMRPMGVNDRLGLRDVAKMAIASESRKEMANRSPVGSHRIHWTMPPTL